MQGALDGYPLNMLNHHILSIRSGGSVLNQKKTSGGSGGLFCLAGFVAVCFLFRTFFASVTRKFTAAGQSCIHPETGQDPFIHYIPDGKNADQG